MSTSPQKTDNAKTPLTSKGRPVPQAKVDEVAQLVKQLENYEYIALLRTEQIGSKQFQAIKKALRPDAVIHMSRNSLMERALRVASKKKKNLEKLIPYIEGSMAFAFSNVSPFELNDMLLANKAKAPAKVGTVSPVDIDIAAGNTGFPPGPLISELGQVGLKTRIKGGSIWITEDHTIVEVGETVSREKALVMSRLGLEPYEIYLKLTVAYDEGVILSADVFTIRRSHIVDKLSTAAQEGLSLALTVDYISPETLPILLQQAFQESQNLSLFAGILTDETTGKILASLEQGANNLAQLVRNKNSDAMPN